MKTLLLIAFLFPLAVIAQNVPVKGTKRIIITTQDSASMNYKRTLLQLLESGLSIDAKDSDLFTIRTQVSALRKTSGSYFLNIYCRNNQIIVSGKVKLGFDIDFGGVKTVDDFTDIVNKGMKGSIQKIAFDTMNELSLKIGSEISYSN